MTPLTHRAGHEDRHADPVRAAVGSRRRSHRQRRRGVRAVRQERRGVRWSSSTSERRRRSMRSRRRASISAARSVPGVQISADALFQRAARLPRIDVRKPAQTIGRTTIGAMESGLFYGYVGLVEGLVRRMGAELGGNAVCVATGGLAGDDRAGNVAHRSRRSRSDASRAENRVGTEPVDYCREIETLPLPEERRPPDSDHRAILRSRLGLGGSRACRSRWRSAASIDISSATTPRGRGGGRCGSISARPTCSMSFDEWRRATGVTAVAPKRTAQADGGDGQRRPSGAVAAGRTWSGCCGV